MDVFTYITLFYYLEDAGLLDIDNRMHLFCLHYVYQPLIKWHLKQFVHGWNNHPLWQKEISHRTSWGLLGFMRLQLQQT